jgi:hypothetical protein
MTTSLSDTGLTFADGSVQPSAAAPQINAFSASVAASVLTISQAAISLAFRSTTLGSGAVTTVTGTPANLVVPASATLGTVSAQQSRLVVLALNNAGTIELAVVNIAGGNDLTETGLISTTAISAAATSASVVYSTTARTSVAYRLLGYIESTQATAGTWATAPSTVQGVGGQALTAMSSLGYGQTWQNVTASRVAETIYYNTTGKPICISLALLTNNINSFSVLYINGVFVGEHGGNILAPVRSQIYGVIPVGASYQFHNAAAAVTIDAWSELR